MREYVTAESDAPARSVVKTYASTVQEPCVGHGAVDGGTADHRNEHEWHAARHLLNRQPRPADIVLADAESARDGADVLEHRAELRQSLRHPGECEAIALPFERDWRRADVQSEDPVASTWGYRSVPRQGERAADHRVPSHGHFGTGRKNPHAHVRIGSLRVRHERRFREADLARDLLHRRRPTGPAASGNTAS